MRPKYSCEDCGIDTCKGKINYFSVKDKLWNTYGAGTGWLCLACFQNRLGRPFIKDEFKDCILNREDNPVVREILNKEVLLHLDLQQKTGQIIKPDDLLIYLYSPAAGSSNYQCDFEKKSP